MVRQFVKRGDIVWNFPGGQVELGESPEQACVRELKEETGYDVVITRRIFAGRDKITYEVSIAGGTLNVDKTNPDNADIVEAAWIPLTDHEKFDSITRPMLVLIRTSGEHSHS